ncbi:MAG TPA: DUF6569 family protein, partial [Ktedonobacterales bacterium]|nr:DUF6569 family protein [Ktedonobacterales bacterium]
MPATLQGTGRTAAQAVMDRLRQIEIGAVTTHERVAIFPIFAAAGGGVSALEYRTLAEALADGSVRVAEREQASVPELVLQNTGTTMVLILDGEEIVGGRQNRVVNASFLVPAHMTTPLPVTCVEHGRWHDTSPVFSSGEASNMSMRSMKHAQVTASLRTSGRHLSDQGAIWDSVAHTSDLNRTSSPSGAMHDVYRSRASDISSYQQAFPYVAGALGLLVALNGQVVGADLFDQARTAEQVWPKLVRSYALDALTGEPGAAIEREDAERLLEAARNARYEVFPSLALGEDVRFESDAVIGGGLVYQDLP